MAKKIVVINDFTTCAEIALGVQMPILRDMGIEVFPVPTKLLSYPLCHEGATAMSTLSFASEMLENWIKTEEVFDMVLTGFIPETGLLDKVYKFCCIQKEKGAKILVDPVIGDNGQAYKSVTPENIEAEKRLLTIADLCLPNYTEACIFTETPYEESGITSTDGAKILKKLNDLGVSVPLITGCLVDNKDAVICREGDGKYSTMPFERVNGSVSGTGDRFAALLAGYLLNGNSLDEAISLSETEITKELMEYW